MMICLKAIQGLQMRVTRMRKMNIVKLFVEAVVAIITRMSFGSAVTSVRSGSMGSA